MSESKHTPGPWLVGREFSPHHMPRIDILREVTFVEGGAPTTYRIAEVGYPTSTEGTVGALERAANARLIAAAPDMLEALRVAESGIEELCNGQDPENECWNTLRTIRAAISKAEA